MHLVNNNNNNNNNNNKHEDIYSAVIMAEPLRESVVADIRLAGSEELREGRLEVNIGGKWGTVCDDYFGKEDADVACIMLGLGYVCISMNLCI